MPNWDSGWTVEPSSATRFYRYTVWQVDAAGNMDPNAGPIGPTSFNVHPCKITGIVDPRSTGVQANLLIFRADCQEIQLEYEITNWNSGDNCFTSGIILPDGNGPHTVTIPSETWAHRIWYTLPSKHMTPGGGAPTLININYDSTTCMPAEPPNTWNHFIAPAPAPYGYLVEYTKCCTPTPTPTQTPTQTPTPSQCPGSQYGLTHAVNFVGMAQVRFISDETSSCQCSGTKTDCTGTDLGVYICAGPIAQGNITTLTRTDLCQPFYGTVSVTGCGLLTSLEVDNTMIFSVSYDPTTQEYTVYIEHPHAGPITHIYSGPAPHTINLPGPCGAASGTVYGIQLS